MDSLIVLLSSYNGAAYIEKQIESLLNQTLAPNMRIIVREDRKSTRLNSSHSTSSRMPSSA